ncbi:hypothetical protein SAMN05446927_8167 [Caballeronia arationis]|uniref:Uncharacterized protein n=1 Tax=Caballeronia arationis TaxID=1777142 RepID=A0A7Z7N731_9BURK|nr:hypothetical protein SAMN05446927_8167 [Caballeronia arationis]
MTCPPSAGIFLLIRAGALNPRHLRSPRDRERRHRSVRRAMPRSGSGSSPVPRQDPSSGDRRRTARRAAPIGTGRAGCNGYKRRRDELHTQPPLRGRRFQIFPPCEYWCSRHSNRIEYSLPLAATTVELQSQEEARAATSLETFLPDDVQSMYHSQSLSSTPIRLLIFFSQSCPARTHVRVWLVLRRGYKTGPKAETSTANTARPTGRSTCR